MIVRGKPFASFVRATPAQEILDKVAAFGGQDVFPVLDNGALVGSIGIEIVRTLAQDPDLRHFTLADDLMTQPRGPSRRTTICTRRSRRSSRTGCGR